MLATQNNGLYTVIDSQLGIIAHKVSRQVAIDSIYAAIDDSPKIEQVTALLDATPDSGAWRTEWAAATAVDLQQLDERLDNTPTIQELKILREELDTLTTEQEAILGEIKLEAKNREIETISEQLQAEHKRLIQVLADDVGADFEDTLVVYSRAVWKHIGQTQLYRDYLKLIREAA